MVIDVTQTPEGIAISVDGAAARLLEWVEGWKFRRGEALVMFRRDGKTGPASELRFDTIGDYFVLKRK